MLWLRVLVKDFKCEEAPEGIELNFGNGEGAVISGKMIRIERHRDILAEGTRRASKHLDNERGTDSGNGRCK